MQLQRIAGSRPFQTLITLSILFAGALVGVETSPDLVARYGALLHALDRLVLAIFVVELLIKLGAEGRRPWRFFQDPWNVFDFLIVATALLPISAQHLMVLRLVRLFRVLRLVRALPKLQILVTALIKSIPSMGYVALLLGLVFYIYGVAGTFLFGANDPVHFGNLPTALLSLFRVVTLEGWTELLYIQMRGCNQFGYGDFAALCTQPQPQPVAAVVFFVSFVLLGTMIILNLFIGVIMSGMEEAAEEEEERRRLAVPSRSRSLEHELEELERAMAEMQQHLARLRKTAAHQRPAQPGGPNGAHIPETFGRRVRREMRARSASEP
ncbi:ion transporter [Archangium minus]|uniref:Ion transporter n=1 Tax=Archangium minus TaxID=83450 RepID=A0ABY9X4M9_9BACT|nr:ion transporter [Archangium violaceum]WNG50356.1 ion transporter [Archangium minus]